MQSDRVARIAFFLLAALIGVGIGLFDRAQSEVQPAVILLLACTFVLACARPKDAWVYGLVIGAGVPIVDLVARTLAVPAPWPSVPGSRLIAFLPAVLGAGAGALLRVALKR
jgi:hypothetical protein